MSHQTASASDSLLLGIDHFDAIAGREELELLHRDSLLASEVPSDQILKLPFGKFKATSFDQATELINVDLLCALLLNSVEESLQELVILRLICKLIGVISIEGSHKFTEFSVIDSIWLSIHGI